MTTLVDAGPRRDANGHRAETKRLFRQLTQPTLHELERQSIRDELIILHLPLVEHIARRYRDRNEPLEDLVQVGTIGLIKATDRFDPSRGVEFSTYAMPTILGEIKRHFRDKGWSVRVPRRLQELRMSLSDATTTLTQELGRSPTVAELADRLGTAEEAVLEGLESANAYATVPLDSPTSEDSDDSLHLAARLGTDDPGLEGVENRQSLIPLLAQLPDRDRKILMLRFFRGMTQSQIGAELGISQMHVSRLLARTLTQLREQLLTEE
jgi:RNA polymerase sigma-B factor